MKPLRLTDFLKKKKKEEEFALGIAVDFTLKLEADLSINRSGHVLQNTVNHHGTHACRILRPL